MNKEAKGMKLFHTVGTWMQSFQKMGKRSQECPKEMNAHFFKKLLCMKQAVNGKLNLKNDSFYMY